MAAVIFSARANLGLVLIARSLIALLGIWGILGMDAAFGEVPAAGNGVEAPPDSLLGGLGTQGANPSVDGAPGLCQAAAPGKFSPGQGGSLNFGAAGGGTLHPG